MVNPVSVVADFFLWFFQSMPTVIQTFVFLAMGVYFINVVVHLIFR